MSSLHIELLALPLRVPITKLSHITKFASIAGIAGITDRPATTGANVSSKNYNSNIHNGKE